jgi:HD-like signal output (HDOD) protein
LAKRDATAGMQAGALDALRAQFSARIEHDEIAIPMLPDVAAQVVAAAGNPRTSARDMAQIILADPALAAHVMRVVTSAAYRPAQPIASLHHAISWLGMAEVCELAFTAAVQSKLMDVQHPLQRRRAERLWCTAVGAAAWGRAIAQACGRGGEESYLAGLMHEIGVLVCLQLLSDLAQDTGVPVSDPMLDALTAEFKTRVGSRVARQWRLPGAVAAVIDGWADWAFAHDHADACAVTFLAHQLAEHTLARSEPLALSIADDPVVARLGLTPLTLAGLVDLAPDIRVVVDSFRPRP